MNIKKEFTAKKKQCKDPVLILACARNKVAEQCRLSTDWTLDKPQCQQEAWTIFEKEKKLIEKRAAKKSKKQENIEKCGWETC